MAELKLSKLPDRTPVKFTITVNPELAQALRDYAACYRAAYEVAEDISELIPYMLAAFIDSDAGFRKAKRDRQVPAITPDRSVSERARSSAQSSATSQESTS